MATARDINMTSDWWVFPEGGGKTTFEDTLSPIPDINFADVTDHLNPIMCSCFRTVAHIVGKFNPHKLDKLNAIHLSLIDRLSTFKRGQYYAR